MMLKIASGPPSARPEGRYSYRKPYPLGAREFTAVQLSVYCPQIRYSEVQLHKCTVYNLYIHKFG